MQHNLILNGPGWLSGDGLSKWWPTCSVHWRPCRLTLGGVTEKVQEPKYDSLSVLRRAQVQAEVECQPKDEPSLPAAVGSSTFRDKAWPAPAALIGPRSELTLNGSHLWGEELRGQEKEKLHLEVSLSCGFTMEERQGGPLGRMNCLSLVSAWKSTDLGVCFLVGFYCCLIVLPQCLFCHPSILEEIFLHLSWGGL